MSSETGPDHIPQGDDLRSFGVDQVRVWVDSFGHVLQL